MMKTLTLRVDDDVYTMIKHASEGARRNISNFIEYATLQYLTSSQYVDQTEMDEILGDTELMASLKQGMKEARSGDHTLVR
jgi:predicted transcriptional regulator